jgi:hypothetical protein
MRTVRGCIKGYGSWQRRAVFFCVTRYAGAAPLNTVQRLLRTVSLESRRSPLRSERTAQREYACYSPERSGARKRTLSTDNFLVTV